MATENDPDNVVPLRAVRTDLCAPGTDAPPRPSAELVDLKRIEMMRDDFRTITRQLRLGTAAQLVAAARELIDGEPGYEDDERFLDELQVQLQSDSV